MGLDLVGQRIDGRLRRAARLVDLVLERLARGAASSAALFPLPPRPPPSCISGAGVFVAT